MDPLNIILTEAEKQEIINSVSKTEYQPHGDCEYIEELRKIAYKHWPEKVINALNSINKKAPWVVIENLPVDYIEKVPLIQEKVSDWKKTSVSENTIIACASIVGEPYTIFAEGEEIVNNLIPFKETQNDCTGLGSAVELDFHIENSALNFLYPQDNLSPSSLLLLGIYANPKNPVATKLADARLALQLLSEEDIKILREPNYKIQTPYRWRKFLPENKLETEAIPLIVGNPENPRIFAVFYHGMITPLNEIAKKTLANFYNSILKVEKSEVLKNGRLVCINNKFALHARGSFSPHYNEEQRGDRWLQRVFTTKDLSSFDRIEKINGRVFLPSYKYN